ncbi:TonB-dependent receptor domain-containing protein [Erythrobacter sp. W302b]|uniref:TonB-dependent receptor domain-containing protein n=1 Tax=Erythrobacter sp. W302b TaxID=3389874 RepID=UPI00396AF669
MRAAPLWIAAALGCPAAVSAQEAGEPPPVDIDTSTQASGAPPIGDADNAYGLRVGNEEIGLYDTGSIRGFALDAGANYRLDGAYFAFFAERSGRVDSSAAIQAGPNLFAARFPSPTGVVDIGTDNEATPRRNLILRGDGFGSVEAIGRIAVPIGGGTIWGVGQLSRLDNWHGGRDAFSYGAVGGAVERGSWQVRGGASLGHYRDMTALAVFPAAAPADLPTFRPGDAAAPDWAATEGWELLSWGQIERRLGDGWTARLALAYGTFTTEREAFVFLDRVDASGQGTLGASVFGATSGSAMSGEALVERQWDAPHGPARISFAIIGRDQHSDLASADDITLGPARINDRASPADPGPPSGIAATDLIREGRLAASASFPLTRWLLVSGSVQRVHYTKDYTPAGEATPQRTDREWAGHLAATVAVAERLSFYGAWVTGLEESGSAPAIAVNANETLPALRASQREVGAKWKVTLGATLLVSAFDITKGAPGFDTAGRWVLNGTRRHRGIEASLVAPIGPVQVVAGALYLDAAIREAGGSRAEVVGQPRWRGSVNAQWQATPRLAVDAGAYILGDAPARRDGTTTVPARADLSLGITWALGSTDTAPTLRIAGSNLLDNRGWDANDDESLTPIESRALRASLAFAW